jgi:hypothetical protein
MLNYKLLPFIRSANFALLQPYARNQEAKDRLENRSLIAMAKIYVSQEGQTAEKLFLC